MSTHCGAAGQLSEHDGEIIEVFTPCHQKMICSAHRQDPQHTIKQRVVPASVHFYNVYQGNLRLSPFSLTPSELNPIYIQTEISLPGAFTLACTDIDFLPCSASVLRRCLRKRPRKGTLGNLCRTAGCPVEHVSPLGSQSTFSPQRP